MARTAGLLTLAELTELIDADRLDTVLVCFSNIQGQLMGKRVTGHFFLDHTVEHGIEACDYLLATDVEMNVLPGFRVANWDQGYGDMRAVPDLATLRRIPWLEKTALVLCDLVDPGGKPMEVSPRQVLKRQIERAAKVGLAVMAGAELEFYLFRETFEEAAAKGYRGLTPHSNTVEDYHILQTSKDEYVIRAIRNGMDGAGIAVECSKGEAGYGQHEVNLRYDKALAMADKLVIYKNGAKEIAALAGRAVTFMAKYSMADTGSSCHVHSSVWSVDGEHAQSHDPGRPHGISDVFAHYIAGLLATAADFSICFAPTVNSYKRFQPGSWAPTALVWGRDNRTCGLRTVGHGASTRVESRIPGADVNPYLAFAGVIAGGLHGIRHGLALGDPFVGNAYEAPDVPRIPWTLIDAIGRFETSSVAMEAFGEVVHHHLSNSARQEWAQFNGAVTDWELRRNFERI